jgi:peptide chain release factor 3
LDQAGRQTPLFFGSAITNFGVETFLNTFLHLARSPPPRAARVTQVSELVPFASARVPVPVPVPANGLTRVHANDSEFSAFVFKLQANLDPRHRDRMAFLRVCSGVYRKGMKVQHSRSERSGNHAVGASGASASASGSSGGGGGGGKEITLSSAQALFAQERESVEVAYPGDVIGVHNSGAFAIGDTLYTGNRRIVYPGIPSFSPEKFAFIRNPVPSLYKKFYKVRNIHFVWVYPHVPVLFW